LLAVCSCTLLSSCALYLASGVPSSSIAMFDIVCARCLVLTPPFASRPMSSVVQSWIFSCINRQEKITDTPRFITMLLVYHEVLVVSTSRTDHVPSQVLLQKQTFFTTETIFDQDGFK
jgi:hypothetical protein